MSTRSNPLRDAMLGIKQADSPPPAQELAPSQPAAPAAVPQSRVGKRAITGHFEPEVQRQLRKLAADQDRTSQAILEEALNDLFRKYNLSAIA